VEKYLKCAGEQIYDLPCNGLKIIQHQNSYRFGIDSVLLANFVKAGKDDRIMDLGTGSGVIAILLAAKTGAREIVGIEIAKAVFDRAARSVEMNKLQGRVKIVHGDLKEAPKISPNPEMALARHEVKANLKDLVSSAWELLKFGGRFYMIYRAARLADAMYELRAKDLEPKLLQFIQPRADEGPNLFLVMAKKGASAGLEILPPLVLYGSDGTYVDEVKAMYFGKGREV